MKVHYSRVKLYDTDNRTNRDSHGRLYRSLHGRLRNCASIPCRDRQISIPQSVKRGSGPQSYSGGTGNTFFRDEGAGASSWPFLHLVPNLRICGVTPNFRYAFVALCLVRGIISPCCMTLTTVTLSSELSCLLP